MMKLDDTSFSSNLSQDFRERELRKRVYWYLYAIDMSVYEVVFLRLYLLTVR